MSRRGLFVALAVVLVVNAGALVSVARNRAGEPDATLALDERELELQPGERENSGLLLRLRYLSGPFPEEDPRAAGLEDALASRVIDRAKLEALGFNGSIDPGNQRAAAFYGAVLPRPAFVVFALGGPEWDRHVAAWQERRRRDTGDRVARGVMKGEDEARARAEIAEAPQRLSRLVAIDVGPDAAALRAQYADRARHLILRGVVRLHHVDASAAGGPSLHGHLIDVFPAVLNVPRGLRAPLDALRELPRRDRTGPTPRRGLAMLDRAPRYEVRVAVGRGWQPWVAEVRLLQ